MRKGRWFCEKWPRKSAFEDIDLESQKEATEDHVLHAYACDVLSLGLLYMEFQDAIREGDGLRIQRCWKYMLLIYKASNRSNYSIEAFATLANIQIVLPPRPPSPRD